MVELTGRYLGELRCETVHGPSGNKLVTDAPTDNRGKGAAFSPTDLVAASLATCVVTIMGIAANERGISIDGCTYHVSKEMVADPKRRIGRIETTIRLPEELSAADRRVLENIAHACPVHRSLAENVETPVTFEYV